MFVAPRQSDVPAAAAGVQASGERSVAVGGNAVVVHTYDNSPARIVHLLAEMWQPIAEVEAPPGI
ncbi:hypothetical protein IFM12276_31650 [Nocardia sputorum]|uniref:Uncharacterized protein n=1 Tax=Nocardia sputorum TaxID=2984338 RepID=A0ABM8CYN3_9NOCA|nr:hypothetical protein IFM12276_31650 [Nocardia sputorum]